MKKRFISVITLAVLLWSCGDKNAGTNETSSSEQQTETNSETEEKTTPEASSYDPKRGEGKYTAESLKLTEKLDVKKAEEGEKVSNIKCTSCHKLSDEKLVGPGWKGVTTRRTPEWIMNFITNPDPMLNKDPEAQAMLELCLVRMPNQNLTDDEARNILEFLRKNDGLK